MAYDLFIDGFDYYAISQITSKWFSYAGGRMDIVSPGRRASGKCLYLNDDQSNRYVRSKPFAPSTHVTVGFAFYLPTNGSGFVLDFYSESGAQFRMQLNSGTNTISASRYGAAVDKTSTQYIDYNTWNYVECGLYCSDTGSYEVRVNGSATPWISNASYDTCVYSGKPITYIILARTSAVGPGPGYFDDLYFAYGDEIKFLGDCRVDTLALTSNSSPQDWVPDTGDAYARLNQDAGYITSSTVNAVSLFNVADITHNPNTIHGIQVNGHAYKSDAGTRDAATVLKSGGTTVVGNSLALATGTMLLRDSYIVDPNTGSAFTKANLNTIEVGAKVTA